MIIQIANFVYVYMNSMRRELKLVLALRVLLSCFTTKFDVEYSVKDAVPIILPGSKSHFEDLRGSMFMNNSTMALYDEDEDEDVNIYVHNSSGEVFKPPTEEEAAKSLLRTHQQNMGLSVNSIGRKYTNYYFSNFFLLQSGLTPFNFVVSVVQWLIIAQWFTVIVTICMDLTFNIRFGVC